MSTKIYYFSGTGNSLVVARDIAGKVNGELVSIPSVMDKESINTNADVVGIVFPVYHGSYPYIIKRFVEKMTDIENKYIYGVCTYGDSPGIAIKHLGKILKKCGGKLAAGFSVNMPYNYIFPSSFFKGDFFRSFVLREVALEKQNEMLVNWRKKIETFCEFVRTKKEGEFETELEIINGIIDFLGIQETLGKYCWLKITGFKGKTKLPFLESLHLMDAGFFYDEKCSGCGICAKVCPVRNITMIDNKPSWQHHCEQCFACLQWCPEEAIQFSKNTSKGKRYHHPDVKLSDMLI